MTPKQTRFVEEYLVDLNATQAATRAGYSAKTANEQGCRLLANAHIRDAIAAAQAERSERTLITQDRVLEEYARIGFIDPRSVMSWGPDGVRFIPSEELSAEAAAAVAEVHSETRTFIREDGTTETVVKQRLKLVEKKGALDSLARHLGMFNDKLTLNVDELPELVVRNEVE